MNPPMIYFTTTLLKQKLLELCIHNMTGIEINRLIYLRRNINHSITFSFMSRKPHPSNEIHFHEHNFNTQETRQNSAKTMTKTFSTSKQTQFIHIYLFI